MVTKIPAIRLYLLVGSWFTNYYYFGQRPSRSPPPPPRRIFRRLKYNLLLEKCSFDHWSTFRNTIVQKLKTIGNVQCNSHVYATLHRQQPVRIKNLGPSNKGSWIPKYEIRLMIMKDELIRIQKNTTVASLSHYYTDSYLQTAKRRVLQLL
jgi:hypothetical protein